MEGNTSSVAFDTLAATRELEAAGMDRNLAEVTVRNMQKIATAAHDLLATKADLAESRAELEADMLKTAVGIVLANAGFVLAAVKFPS